MFEQRLDAPEFLDVPECSPETIRISHTFMRWVNRCFGGTAAVRQFIRCAAAAEHADGGLNILDIGSGSGDIPRSILRWAAAKNIDVRFTCVEKTEAAIQSAPNAPAVSDPRIVFVHEDIFSYQPEGCFDYAVASMFLHHLSAEQITALIKHLRPFIRKGIFINDLHRTAFTYISCLLVSWFLPAQVRHDALTSIRKGFQRHNLRTLLAVPGSTVRVNTRPWGRITALLEWKGNHS